MGIPFVLIQHNILIKKIEILGDTTGFVRFPLGDVTCLDRYFTLKDKS